MHCVCFPIFLKKMQVRVFAKSPPRRRRAGQSRSPPPSGPISIPTPLLANYLVAAPDSEYQLAVKAAQVNEETIVVFETL